MCEIIHLTLASVDEPEYKLNLSEICEASIYQRDAAV